jgi:O-antigen ligase
MVVVEWGLPIRFGYLMDASGIPILNPNEVGVQLALAALLSLFLHEKTQRKRWLILTLAFGIVVFWTGSRSAFVTLLTVIGVAQVLVHRSRLNWIIGGGLTALCIIVLFGIRVAPLSVLEERFLAQEELVTLHRRTEIFTPVYDALISSGKNLTVGAGLGGTWKAVGRFASSRSQAEVGEDGVVRLHTHNGYLEWLLSCGLIGALLGLVVLGKLARLSVELDRVDGSWVRTRLLLFGLVFSLTGVPFHQIWWVTFGSLFLALNDPPGELEIEQIDVEEVVVIES